MYSRILIGLKMFENSAKILKHFETDENFGAI